MSKIIHFIWVLLQQILNPSCTIRAASIAKNVKLENFVTLKEGVHLGADSVGKYTFINKNVIVDKNTKSIGRFCSIAYGVKIGLGNHPLERISTHPFSYSKKYNLVDDDTVFSSQITTKTIIGNDVWIGANAIILAGVNIGDGAVVGANSLVTRDVESYSVVMGTPANHSKYRFDEEKRKELLKEQWWNWNDSKIKEQISLFQTNC
jgi:acetyltransferase-like isoleucine patch superfamily enzyme